MNYYPFIEIEQDTGIQYFYFYYRGQTTAVFLTNFQYHRSNSIKILDVAMDDDFMVRFFILQVF